MLLYILCFFILIVTIQFFYYIFIFGKFSFSESQKNNLNRISISVIVCAKNEAENVSRLIPLLAQQNYPNFEIILIDNASSDNTLEIFEEFEKEYPNIRLVKVKNNEAFWGNKKYALTLGIKTAKNDYLLFLNPDSVPASKDWISSMSSQFSNQKTIVLGYGAYEKIPKSFLNKIIRFESMFQTMSFFSWAKIGHPYYGTGRNLAYKKEEFFKVNGFIKHIQVSAGEDDLFINEVANRINTTISFAPESYTHSNHFKTFKSWFEQKKIVNSTKQYYSLFNRLQLAIFNFSNYFFILLAVVLVVFQFELILVLSLIGFRYLFVWVSVGISAKKLKEKDLIIWIPFLEILQIYTQLMLLKSTVFSKSKRWK